MKRNSAGAGISGPKKKASSVKVPLSWRMGAWLGSLVIGASIFLLFFFKISRTGAPNPNHPYDPLETALFGLVFGGLGAALIKMLVIDKVLLRVAEKRSAVEIIEEVAKDVVVVGAAAAVEGVIDAVVGSGSDSSESSSSSGSPSGGGGQFGGGGASGKY